MSKDKPPRPLTLSLLDTLCRKYYKSRANRPETIHEYLTRTTHLNIDHAHLSELNNHLLDECKALKVLYLHDNSLSTLSISKWGSHVTHLYAQNNQLEHVTKLYSMMELEKCYLSNNQLQVLSGFAREEEQQHHTSTDGIESNDVKPSNETKEIMSDSAYPIEFLNIIELQCNSQRIHDPTIGLTFSLPSMFALSQSLRILSLSNNHIHSQSLLMLHPLSQLTALNLSSNVLTDVPSLTALLHELHHLQELDIRDNPLPKNVKIRDALVLACASLVTLDGKGILSTEREFLYRLHLKKNGRLKSEKPITTKPTVGPKPPAFPYMPRTLSQKNVPNVRTQVPPRTAEQELRQLLKMRRLGSTKGLGLQGEDATVEEEEVRTENSTPDLSMYQQAVADEYAHLSIEELEALAASMNLQAQQDHDNL